MYSFKMAEDEKTVTSEDICRDKQDVTSVMIIPV